MAATNEEEMENMLTLVDQISDDLQNGIDEFQTLKSNYNAEINNRQSLELTCSTLRRENDRLKNLHLQTLNNLTDLLQQRGDSPNLREELKKLTDESLRKEEEHRRAIELLKRNHDEKIRVLEDRIRDVLSQKGADDEKIRVLEGRVRDILSQKGADDEKIRVLEGRIRDVLSQKGADEATIYQLHHELISHRNRLKDLESKYQSDVEDLKDCIFVEEQEKKELSDKVKNLEKELLVMRTKMVEQHVSSSDKQLETLKQKMMKLRKENEVLKRQLLASKES